MDNYMNNYANNIIIIRHNWLEYFNNEYFNNNLNMLYDDNTSEINWSNYFFNDYYYYYYYNLNIFLLDTVQNIINNNDVITLNYDKYIENIETVNLNLEECPICFESSNSYDIIKKCKHKFCNKCLSKWLLENGHNCPICRLNLIN